MQGATTGFVSNAHSRIVHESPVTEAMISAIFGAFIGLIAAFIVTQTLRTFAAHALLNQIGQTRFTMITSLLGAIGFTLVTLLSDDD